MTKYINLICFHTSLGTYAQQAPECCGSALCGAHPRAARTCLRSLQTRRSNSAEPSAPELVDMFMTPLLIPT